MNKEIPKKIVILDPKEFSSATGGRIVEKLFFDTIKEQNFSEFELLHDKKLGAETKTQKLFSYWKIRKRILEADIVFANSSNRRLVCFLQYLKKKKSQIKLIVIHHHFEYLTYANHSISRSIHKLIEENILKGADDIVTFGEYTEDLLKQKFNDKIIHCLGVPFDKSVCKPLSSYDKGKMVFVGNVEPRKGLDYLIKALMGIKTEFCLEIVGKYDKKDPYYNELVSMITGSGIEKEIHFLGRVSDEEKDNIYSSSSLFVFPSLNEGYGMVIIEAMAYGLPVIAFNNSSIPYIVKDEYNGYLVKDKDIQDLSLKIEKALSERDKLPQLGMNCRKTYNEVTSIQQFCLNTIDFVNSSLK